MKQLTNEEHVKRGGDGCPLCGSHDTDGGFVNIDNGRAYQPVSCNDCGAQWSDIYQLIGYEET